MFQTKKLNLEKEKRRLTVICDNIDSRPNLRRVSSDSETSRGRTRTTGFMTRALLPAASSAPYSAAVSYEADTELGAGGPELIQSPRRSWKGDFGFCVKSIFCFYYKFKSNSNLCI